jgi:carbonic anhydrase
VPGLDDEILARLKRFHFGAFRRFRRQFRELVEAGQHPTTLFISCSDSRIVPNLLLDCGPGDLFVVRNAGNFVPPWDGGAGYHGTAASIEFAVLSLKVKHIVLCGHSHCGAIKALYHDAPPEAHHLRHWLALGRGAVLPVRGSPEAYFRTEQRSVALQLTRLLEYPMVRERVERGELSVHGWHYLIDEGKVLMLDLESGSFEPFETVVARADAEHMRDVNPLL